MTAAGRQAGVKDFRNAPTPRRGAPARARRATGMSPRLACGRTHNGGSSDVRVIPGPGGVELSRTFMRFQSRRSDRTADCWPFICRNRMHSHPSADGMRLPRGVCQPSAHPLPRRTSDRQEGICNPLFSAVAREGLLPKLPKLAVATRRTAVGLYYAGCAVACCPLVVAAGRADAAHGHEAHGGLLPRAPSRRASWSLAATRHSSATRPTKGSSTGASPVGCLPRAPARRPGARLCVGATR